MAAMLHGHQPRMLLSQDRELHATGRDNLRQGRTFDLVLILAVKSVTLRPPRIPSRRPPGLLH